MTTKMTETQTLTTNEETKKPTSRRNTKKDTPQPEPTKTIEIMTNGISNGKKNYFTFTQNKKMITSPFFPTQHGEQGTEYPYQHHINGNILDTLGKKYTDYNLFSYENRTDHKGFETLTTQSHGDLMKYNLYKLLQDGTQSIIHNDTRYTMKWIGEPIPEPQLKMEKPKKEKKEKISTSELEGLDFTELLK